jgi:hypothetical protein
MLISLFLKTKAEKTKKSLALMGRYSIFAPLKREVMSKKFSTKKMRLRGKASRRRQLLRVNPAPVVRKPTIEESNRAAIAAIEAKIQA